MFHHSLCFHFSVIIHIITISSLRNSDYSNLHLSVSIIILSIRLQIRQSIPFIIQTFFDKLSFLYHHHETLKLQVFTWILFLLYLRNIFSVFIRWSWIIRIVKISYQRQLISIWFFLPIHDWLIFPKDSDIKYSVNWHSYDRTSPDIHRYSWWREAFSLLSNRHASIPLTKWRSFNQNFK